MVHPEIWSGLRGKIWCLPWKRFLFPFITVLIWEPPNGLPGRLFSWWQSWFRCFGKSLKKWILNSPAPCWCCFTAIASHRQCLLGLYFGADIVCRLCNRLGPEEIWGKYYPLRLIFPCTASCPLLVDFGLYRLFGVYFFDYGHTRALSLYGNFRRHGYDKRNRSGIFSGTGKPHWNV